MIRYEDAERPARIELNFDSDKDFSDTSEEEPGTQELQLPTEVDAIEPTPTIDTSKMSLALTKHKFSGNEVSMFYN